MPLQLLFAELFRALHRIDYASIFSGGTLFGGFGAGLVIGMILLIIHYQGFSLNLSGVLAMIIIISSMFLVMEIILIWRMLRCMPRNQHGNERQDWDEHIKQSFPFLIVALCTFSIIHMDTVILGIYRPEEEVAVYSATSRLVKFISLGLIVAYEVAAPFIVELGSSGEFKKLEKMLRLIAMIAALPSIILLSIFVIFPESTLVFLYGDYYREGVLPLVILSIGQMINVWTGLSGYTLNMLGYQKVNMYISVVVTLAAIFSMIFLAGEHGVLAVSLVISTAWIIKNVITLLLVKYYTGIWTHAGFMCMRNT